MSNKVSEAERSISRSGKTPVRKTILDQKILQSACGTLDNAGQSLLKYAQSSGIILTDNQADNPEAAQRIPGQTIEQSSPQSDNSHMSFVSKEFVDKQLKSLKKIIHGRNTP